MIGRADDYVRPDGKHMVMWQCRCSCGTERNIRSYRLTSGKTLSCGHMNGKRLIGQSIVTRQGFPITVIARDGWTLTVRFPDGATKDVPYRSFRNGRISHPDWNVTKPKTGKYLGIAVNGLAYRMEENAYYYCTIPNGSESILSPSEMIDLYTKGGSHLCQDSRIYLDNDLASGQYLEEPRLKSFHPEDGKLCGIVGVPVEQNAMLQPAI